MDNSLSFASAFDMYSAELDEAYRTNLNFGNSVVTALLACLLAIGSVVGIMYTHFSIVGLRKEEATLIKMFLKVPKKVAMAISTEIEEEIENMNQEDEGSNSLANNSFELDQTIAARNRFHFAFSWQYLLCVFLVLGCTFGTLYPFLSHTGSTGVITEVLNNNIRRRMYTRIMSWLAGGFLFRFAH